MDREALHERIRRLLFVSPALSSSFVRGDFRSVFRGRGMDFDSLREYSADDDSRLIDWNVTVRFAHPYVRSYREDRSLNLFLLIDSSASMEEGSLELSKGDMALLAASLLGHAASYRDMPVGGLLFAEKVLRHFEPRRGSAHSFALVEAAAAASAEASAQAAGGEGGTALAAALEASSRLLKRRSLVILLSDFRATAWERSLAVLARRHDLVAIRLTDALEREPPSAGSFLLRDAEGGGEAWLPLGSGGLRRRWIEELKREREHCRRALSEAKVPLLELDTADDPARRLLEFFDRRRSS